MKMKYVLLLAVAMFAFGSPMADAAPKKSKRAKVTKKSKVKEDDSDVFTPMGIDEAEEADDFSEEQDPEAKEKARQAAMSGAERREENKMLREDTKFYISNQKKTLRILRSVRNERTAGRAVKQMEKIYGEVDPSIQDGAVTAFGVVKVMEEDEEKLPVHQSARATAAALNKAINKEIARIGELNIQDRKFNAVMKKMLNAQR